MLVHAAHSFVFSLLGHCCTVIGADESEERWLRKYWDFSARARTTRVMSITVRFVREPLQTTPSETGAAQSTTLPGLTLMWRRHGPRWWSTGDEETGVELKLSAGKVEIVVRRRLKTASTFPVEPALHVAMCEALRSAGFSPFHAAVIASNNRCTALVGKSGVGKSTALLLAMSQGWHPVAEDFSWLDPTSGYVYGWDRGVRLEEQTVALLRPRWEAQVWKRDDGNKLFLSYDQLAPRKPAHARLNRIALLHRDPTRPSAWEPLGLRDRVRVVCESVGVPLCRENLRYFADHLARVLADIEVARLVVGNTPIPFSASG